MEFLSLIFEIKTKNGLISKLIDFVLKLLAVFKTTPSPDLISAKMSFFKSLSFSKSLISSFLWVGIYGVPNKTVKRKTAIIMPKSVSNK